MTFAPDKHPPLWAKVGLVRESLRLAWYSIDEGRSELKEKNPSKR